MVGLEDNSLAILLLPLLFFIAEHEVTQCGTSLWPVWVCCPGCVPSPSPAHPQPTHGGTGRVEKRGSREAVPAGFSDSRNPGVLSALFQPQTPTTAPYGLR